MFVCIITIALVKKQRDHSKNTCKLRSNIFVLLNATYEQQNLQFTGKLREMAGMASQPCKRIEKNSALLSAYVFLCQAFLNLNLIACLSHHRMGSFTNTLVVCLLQFFVTCEDHCIILWAILKVACLIKEIASYIVRVVTKICIILKMPVPWQDSFNILYNSTLKPHWELALLVKHVLQFIRLRDMEDSNNFF